MRQNHYVETKVQLAQLTRNILDLQLFDDLQDEVRAMKRQLLALRALHDASLPADSEQTYIDGFDSLSLDIQAKAIRSVLGITFTVSPTEALSEARRLRQVNPNNLTQ